MPVAGGTDAQVEPSLDWLHDSNAGPAGQLASGESSPFSHAAIAFVGVLATPVGWPILG